jgi:DNA modification methylase
VIPTSQILVGDALEKLSGLPSESIQCCVTSPPYYGLRDYGSGTWSGGDTACDHKSGRFERSGLTSKQASNTGSEGDEARGECPKCGAKRIDKQLGIENTPGEYIDRLVSISREIRRVLKNDGTFWLNLGDSYYNYRPGDGQRLGKQSISRTHQDLPGSICHRRGQRQAGFKEKDRMMIPARVAIALCDDGWYLRDEIVWHKPNPMPESVTDRCTKTHEFIYMLTKTKDYYYDAEAIKEPISESYASDMRPHGVLRQRFYPNSKYVKEGMLELDKSAFPNGERVTTRNKRSVWTVNTAPCSDAHFATYPPDLIKPCIMAGSKPGDTVLDPFGGRGTTGLVAIELARNCILIELNPKYAALCEAVTADTTPGFAF